MNKSLGLQIDSNLNIRNQNNKIIIPKELKLKNIQKVIDKWKCLHNIFYPAYRLQEIGISNCK